jgi:hypothetical protein
MEPAQMSIYFLVSDDRLGLLKDDVVKIGYSEGNTARRLYDGAQQPQPPCSPTPRSPL